MHHVPPFIRCVALAWFYVTATGCFTPAHLGGIEDAHALAREFGVEQKPRPVFMFGRARMVDWGKMVSGRLTGECERDGVRYREYHFAAALAGERDRCLRVLLPVPQKSLVVGAPDSGSQTESAPSGDALPAIIEEFFGSPAPGDAVLLHLSDGGISFNDKVWAAHHANNESHKLALAGLDGRPSLYWKPIDDGKVWEYMVIDRIRWRQRSGMDVAARIISTPLACVADVGLVVGVLVYLPVAAVGQGLDQLFGGD